MKKRIELTATILMDIDIKEGKSELEQATQQINDWMDKHLDEADGIDLDENNTRLYLDWSGSEWTADGSINFLWEQGETIGKIT